MRNPVLISLIWLLPAPLLADNAALPFTDDAGCMDGPMAQFGRYLGDWRIADSSLSQETGQWQPGAGARWIFSCLGEGAAVQDFWIPVGGPVGSNLRTFNTRTNSWDIAWTIKGAPGMSNITATQNEAGEIVMHYKEPLPDPLRRITFFPPDATGWHWKMEFAFSRDDEDQPVWTEVYRIVATPYEP